MTNLEVVSVEAPGFSPGLVLRKIDRALAPVKTPRSSLAALGLRLQLLQVGNYHVASVHVNQPLGLQAAEVARNQLAHRADLCRQFLIAAGQRDLNTRRRALAGGRQAAKKRAQPLVDGGEGKLLDNAHQSAQAGAHPASHFQGEARVLEAERLKIVLADE